MSVDQSEFAFGANAIGETKCPSCAAGLDPIRREVIEVADLYDIISRRIAREKRGTFDVTGTIDKEYAQSAWLNAITEFEAQIEYQREKQEWRDLDEEEKKAQDRALEEARKVAAELGWDDGE